VDPVPRSPPARYGEALGGSSQDLEVVVVNPPFISAMEFGHLEENYPSDIYIYI